MANRGAKPRERSPAAKKAEKSHQTRPAPASAEATPLRPRIGLEFTLDTVVPHDWTIQAFDPRLPAVLSTPRMIQLMEHASTRAIRGELPAGTISVGTRIEVDHLKAVSDGASVRTYARLSSYQGRFLIFDVEAKSGDIVIGRGRVFRAIVESATHGEKARARVSGTEQ